MLSRMVTTCCLELFGTWGHLGGSVVERLPSAQDVILGSWDRVPHQAPCREEF